MISTFRQFAGTLITRFRSAIFGHPLLVYRGHRIPYTPRLPATEEGLLKFRESNPLLEMDYGLKIGIVKLRLQRGVALNFLGTYG